MAGDLYGNLQVLKQRPVIYRVRTAPEEMPQAKWRVGTVGRFLMKEWLPSLELQIEPTSLRGYRVDVEVHICPGIGHIKVSDLSRADVSEFYRRMAQTPMKNGRLRAKGTVIRVHTTLHRALETLVVSERLPFNPTNGVRPKKRKSERYEASIWTEDELDAFLDFVAKDPQFALWRVAAWTGMRRGEVIGLQWKDFRPEAGTMAVRRAVQYVAGVDYVTAPKTGHARVIELDNESIKILKRHRRRCQAKASQSPWVFTRRNGLPACPSSLSKRFTTLVAESGLPRIRLHDLRHTHASHLILSGANAKVVQERLGHADIVITLNMYSHLLPTSQREAVKGLVRFYNKAAAS